MIRFTRLVFCCAVLSSLAASASADFIPVYSTGATGTGGLTTPGNADAHYNIISNTPLATTSPAYVGTNLPAPWVANTATSEWLSPMVDASAGLPMTQFDFRTTFSLAGLDATSAVIRGQIAADDEVTILVNGVTAYTNIVGFNSFSNFVLSTGFVAGTNTLDFIVTNVVANSPAGLQVNITSATANAVVPEPASILLVGLGGVAAACGYARRRRTGA